MAPPSPSFRHVIQTDAITFPSNTLSSAVFHSWDNSGTSSFSRMRRRRSFFARLLLSCLPLRTWESGNPFYYLCPFKLFKLMLKLSWCFWTMVLEKTLESPLDCKEIQPVQPKGNQSWIFIGRIDAEAETPILWPPDAKSWLIWKDPDAGKDWGQEEKGMTEDEMVGWHYRFNGHEFEWTPGVGDGQGGLPCCNSWGHKELDTTELNWTEVKLLTDFTT